MTRKSTMPTDPANLELQIISLAIKSEMYEKRLTVAEVAQNSKVAKAVVYKIIDCKGYQMSSLLKMFDALELSFKVVKSKKA